MYKHIGKDKFNPFIDRCEDKLKKALEIEINKVKESDMRINVKFKEITDKQINIDETFERMDISTKLSYDFHSNMNSNNWKERKKALEEIDNLLKESSYRINNNGMHDILDSIKKRLKDSNKSILKHAI